MDSRAVSPEHLKAGQDYLDSLVSLGMVPAFLGWGWDLEESQWQLVLVTSIVDAGGPLALNRLLFRAYNAGATPSKISPFIVRIFSPDLIQQMAGDDFWFLGEKNAVTTFRDGTSQKIEGFRKAFMGLDLEGHNAYQILPRAVDRALKGYHAQREEWSKFRRRVEALAA